MILALSILIVQSSTKPGITMAGLLAEAEKPKKSVISKERMKKIRKNVGMIFCFLFISSDMSTTVSG